MLLTKITQFMIESTSPVFFSYLLGCIEHYFRYSNSLKRILINLDKSLSKTMKIKPF